MLVHRTPSGNPSVNTNTQSAPGLSYNNNWEKEQQRKQNRQKNTPPTYHSSAVRCRMYYETKPWNQNRGSPLWLVKRGDQCVCVWVYITTRTPLPNTSCIIPCSYEPTAYQYELLWYKVSCLRAPVKNAQLSCWAFVPHRVVVSSKTMTASKTSTHLRYKCEDAKVRLIF